MMQSAHQHYSGEALNFCAHAGEIICLIGPDHSGKSEWLKTLAGLNPPLSGKLQLLGNDINHHARQDWIRLRTQFAYLSSDTALLSAANGLQNTMMPALYHKLGSRDEILHKARDLLAAINVGCDNSLLPAYIRKDQRFKIALARALILDPAALFMDNPFTLFDSVAVHHFVQFLLQRVHTDQLLLLMVTHNVNFALTHANQILFISHNKVHCFNHRAQLMASEITEIREYLARSLQPC